MHLVAGCVMEGSMVFCQKNILEHSMSFHVDYIEMFSNTQGQSDIVLYKTNIRNKVYLCKRTFSTIIHICRLANLNFFHLFFTWFQWRVRLNWRTY